METNPEIYHKVESHILKRKYAYMKVIMNKKFIISKSKKQ